MSVDCNKLRQLIFDRNPHFYVFGKSSSRPVATMRLTPHFSPDRGVGFAVDVVFHDLNTVWQERVRQIGNNVVLRLRVLYPDEVKGFAKWIEDYVDLVLQYYLFCVDGRQTESQRPTPPPPPMSQPQSGTPPSPPVSNQTQSDLDDLSQV